MNLEKPKMFLGYARIDLGFAEKIYYDLKRYELDIWFDRDILVPVKNIHYEGEKKVADVNWSDVEIGIDLDDSLFSFEIPQGVDVLQIDE